MHVPMPTHPAQLSPASEPVPGPLAAPDAPLPRYTWVGGHFRTLRVAHRTERRTVYVAADRHVLIALKEFTSTGLAPDERAEALAWLAREAGLLATLDHPQLPTLLAAFSEGDRHYLAMPFLEGETLEALVRRAGPLPELAVLQWGLQLADLLAYLHGQDPPLVHRDLKPANILRRPGGMLMLLDLGIAAPVRPGQVGTAIGTPGYAPPEQYQGLADERSDLYALGATLHRLLTGYDPEHAPPFRQPPVCVLNPAVSAATAALVDHLLAPAPATRPPNARAVAATLASATRRYLLEINRPAHSEYRRVLGLLAGSAVLGIAVDTALLPLGLAGPLHLLLVLLPSLLCLLIAAGPERQRVAGRAKVLTKHRRRVRLVLAWGWSTLLLGNLLTSYRLVEATALGVSACLVLLLACWGYGENLQAWLGWRGAAVRRLLASPPDPALRLVATGIDRHRRTVSYPVRSCGVPGPSAVDGSTTIGASRA
jgi:hypothetical protein